MRAMFGLVSLLVVIAIMLWLFSMYSIPTAREGKRAQDQARQISGRGDDGVAAIHSFRVEPNLRGNQLQSLQVTDVTAGGALDTYGLRKGDQIIEINGLKVGDVSNNDPETAKALVHTAFQGNQPIVVLRNGQPITLPQSPGEAAAQSAAGAAAKSPLDAINSSVKIPTH